MILVREKHLLETKPFNNVYYILYLRAFLTYFASHKQFFPNCGTRKFNMLSPQRFCFYLQLNLFKTNEYSIRTQHGYICSNLYNLYIMRNSIKTNSNRKSIITNRVSLFISYNMEMLNDLVHKYLFHTKNFLKLNLNIIKFVSVIIEWNF
jgi:hypothetical protein